MSRVPTPRPAAALVALVLAGGLAAAALPAPPAVAVSAGGTATAVRPAASGASAGGRYLVRATPDRLEGVAAVVADLGGTVVRTLSALGVLVVELPRGAADGLRTRSGVLGVTPDASVDLQGADDEDDERGEEGREDESEEGGLADGDEEATGRPYDPVTDPNSLYAATTVTGARAVWTATAQRPGYTGRGVDVALIDSGVAPVPGLDAPGKVVHGPDLSFESQSPGTRNIDTFGHGTHMAGIIAGRDAGVDATTVPAQSPAFLGMAPDARVVSVKVADAYGATDVSQVIAGIDWVIAHRQDPGFNIRVLNLSFGTPSTQDYRLDPLAHAAEAAWRAGIVVVVSAGNDGTSTGRLANPARDPYVLAVAAANTRGTASGKDDTIAPFSNRGDKKRKPDLSAPGTSVASLRVPGSGIDVRNPSAVVGERYFRGSGTSQAAAIVSGAAALLLQQRPALTPDAVKALLVGEAQRLEKTPSRAQGRGLLRVDLSLAADPTNHVQKFPRSSGTGSLDAARGGQRLVLDGVELSGERDVFGDTFDSAAHATSAEAGKAWGDGTWNGRSWAGRSWASGAWESATWTGRSWAGRSWAGRSWASGQWNGRSWASQSWADTASTAPGALNGRSWAGRGWASGGWQ